jgi:polar amino acid transport system substrate-binding protein
MISLGILVSGVAHEINNPSQFIMSNAGPLQKVWEDALPILDRYYEEHGDFILGGQRYSIRKKRIPEMFKNIMEGTDRIKHIVDELRDYAKENPADLDLAVDLNEVLGSALSLLQNLIKKTTGQFFVTFEKPLPRFMGDYRRIEQVIINLVQNACQAISAMNGRISIATFFDKEQGRVGLQINDTGSGIPKENLARITDPFFTTKRAEGGTGLGLSISQTIMSEHRGSLEFQSEVGEGTTVKMFLPACLRNSEVPA